MTPSTAAGPVPAHSNLAPGMFTPETLATFHLNKALGELRGADKKARHLMMSELSAKQLALNIAQYEELSREEQAQGESQHTVQQAPPGMMED